MAQSVVTSGCDGQKPLQLSFRLRGAIPYWEMAALAGWLGLPAGRAFPPSAGCSGSRSKGLWGEAALALFSDRGNCAHFPGMGPSSDRLWAGEVGGSLVPQKSCFVRAHCPASQTGSGQPGAPEIMLLRWCAPTFPDGALLGPALSGRGIVGLRWCAPWF